MCDDRCVIVGDAMYIVLNSAMLDVQCCKLSVLPLYWHLVEYVNKCNWNVLECMCNG